MNIASFLFILLIQADRLYGLAQQINNQFSKNYMICDQKSCSNIADSLQNEPIELLNYKNDILSYHNCQDQKVSCYFEFYLPFTLINKEACDDLCYNNQSFVTIEFQQNKQCNDVCFLKSYQNNIQIKQMQILNQFGECLKSNEAFKNFDMIQVQMDQDINQYQSCIQQSRQCEKYIQNYNLSSFVDCFKYCSSKIFQTQTFKSHLNTTQSCMNQVLGIDENSSNSSLSINWDQFGLVVGIVCGILFLLIAFYKFYLRKKNLQKMKEAEQKKQEAQEITNNQLKYQQEDIEATNNQNFISPYNQTVNQEGQHNFNMVNIEWANQIHQKHLYQNQNVQCDSSPTKVNNSREETQNHLIKSQFIRSKVDSIFEEIEKERDFKKQKWIQKQEQNEKELNNIQQRQANQVSLNQTDYCQMLDQLRKNFQEVDTHTKDQPSTQQKQNKSQGEKIQRVISSDIQKKEDDKEAENKDNEQEIELNFAQNLQKFLNSVGLNTIQEQPSKSNQASSINKSSQLDKQVQNLSQKIELK